MTITSGELSRRVPARTKTVRFPWVQKGFSVYNEQWRAVRAKCRSPQDTCWWCRRKFDDGESIALAARGGAKTNVVLCEGCADEALSRRGNG